LTVSFAKAAVSIASAVLALFRAASQKVAYDCDVLVGLFDEAHVACVGNDVELASWHSLVQDAGGPGVVTRSCSPTIRSVGFATSWSFGT
jgi:hypothetical protein